MDSAHRIRLLRTANSLETVKTLVGLKGQAAFSKMMAEFILGKWGENKPMVSKAIQAAEAAKSGEPQPIFPESLPLKEEGWDVLISLLRQGSERRP